MKMEDPPRNKDIEDNEHLVNESRKLEEIKANIEELKTKVNLVFTNFDNNNYNILDKEKILVDEYDSSRDLLKKFNLQLELIIQNYRKLLFRVDSADIDSAVYNDIQRIQESLQTLSNDLHFKIINIDYLDTDDEINEFLTGIKGFLSSYEESKRTIEYYSNDLEDELNKNIPDLRESIDKPLIEESSVVQLNQEEIDNSTLESIKNKLEGLQNAIENFSFKGLLANDKESGIKFKNLGRKKSSIRNDFDKKISKVFNEIIKSIPSNTKTDIHSYCERKIQELTSIGVSIDNCIEIYRDKVEINQKNQDTFAVENNELRDNLKKSKGSLKEWLGTINKDLTEYLSIKSLQGSINSSIEVNSANEQTFLNIISEDLYESKDLAKAAPDSNSILNDQVELEQEESGGSSFALSSNTESSSEVSSPDKSGSGIALEEVKIPLADISELDRAQVVESAPEGPVLERSNIDTPVITTEVNIEEATNVSNINETHFVAATPNTLVELEQQESKILSPDINVSSADELNSETALDENKTSLEDMNEHNEKFVELEVGPSIVETTNLNEKERQEIYEKGIKLSIIGGSLDLITLSESQTNTGVFYVDSTNGFLIPDNTYVEDIAGDYRILDKLFTVTGNPKALDLKFCKPAIVKQKGDKWVLQQKGVLEYVVKDPEIVAVDSLPEAIAEDLEAEIVPDTSLVKQSSAIVLRNPKVEAANEKNEVSKVFKADIKDEVTLESETPKALKAVSEDSSEKNEVSKISKPDILEWFENLDTIVLPSADLLISNVPLNGKIKINDKTYITAEKGFYDEQHQSRESIVSYSNNKEGFNISYKISNGEEVLSISNYNLKKSNKTLKVQITSEEISAVNPAPANEPPSFQEEQLNPIETPQSVGEEVPEQKIEPVLAENSSKLEPVEAVEQKEKNNLEGTKEIFKKNIEYDFNIQTLEDNIVGKYNEGREGKEINELMAESETVVIGDLHASALKLIETGVLSNLISLPSENAQQFVELYNEISTGSISDERLKELHNSLEILIESIEWTGENRKFILLGDVINDRGVSDALVLKILIRIREEASLQGNSNAVVNLASNHDHGIIDRTVGDSQAGSKTRAVKIKGGEEMKQLYQEFLKNSNLFYFDIQSETLFAHAPITKFVLKRLIERMNEGLGTKKYQYEEINKDNIAEFIKDANLFYTQYVQEFYQNNEGNGFKRDDLFVKDGLLWNRSDLNNTEQLPFNNIINNFVHGHDDKSEGSDFSISKGKEYKIVNLDNGSRKGDTLDSANEENKLFLLNKNAISQPDEKLVSNQAQGNESSPNPSNVIENNITPSESAGVSLNNELEITPVEVPIVSVPEAGAEVNQAEEGNALEQSLDRKIEVGGNETLAPLPKMGSFVIKNEADKILGKYIIVKGSLRAISGSQEAIVLGPQQEVRTNEFNLIFGPLESDEQQLHLKNKSEGSLNIEFKDPAAAIEDLKDEVIKSGKNAAKDEESANKLSILSNILNSERSKQIQEEHKLSKKEYDELLLAYISAASEGQLSEDISKEISKNVMEIMQGVTEAQVEERENQKEWFEKGKINDLYNWYQKNIQKKPVTRFLVNMGLLGGGALLSSTGLPIIGAGLLVGKSAFGAIGGFIGGRDASIAATTKFFEDKKIQKITKKNYNYEDFKKLTPDEQGNLIDELALDKATLEGRSRLENKNPLKDEKYGETYNKMQEFLSRFLVDKHEQTISVPKETNKDEVEQKSWTEDLLNDLTVQRQKEVGNFKRNRGLATAAGVVLGGAIGFLGFQRAVEASQAVGGSPEVPKGLNTPEIPGNQEAVSLFSDPNRTTMWELASQGKSLPAPNASLEDIEKFMTSVAKDRLTLVGVMDQQNLDLLRNGVSVEDVNKLAEAQGKILAEFYRVHGNLDINASNAKKLIGISNGERALGFTSLADSTKEYFNLNYDNLEKLSNNARAAGWDGGIQSDGKVITDAFSSVGVQGTAEQAIDVQQQLGAHTEWNNPEDINRLIQSSTSDGVFDQDKFNTNINYPPDTLGQGEVLPKSSIQGTGSSIAPTPSVEPSPTLSLSPDSLKPERAVGGNNDLIKKVLPWLGALGLAGGASALAVKITKDNFSKEEQKAEEQQKAEEEKIIKEEKQRHEAGSSFFSQDADFKHGFDEAYNQFGRMPEPDNREDAVQFFKAVLSKRTELNQDYISSSSKIKPENLTKIIENQAELFVDFYSNHSNFEAKKEDLQELAIKLAKIEHEADLDKSADETRSFIENLSILSNPEYKQNKALEIYNTHKFGNGHLIERQKGSVLDYIFDTKGFDNKSTDVESVDLNITKSYNLLTNYFKEYKKDTHLLLTLIQLEVMNLVNDLKDDKLKKEIKTSLMVSDKPDDINESIFADIIRIIGDEKDGQSIVDKFLGLKEYIEKSN